MNCKVYDCQPLAGSELYTLSVEPVPLVFRFADIGPLTAVERLLDVLGQDEPVYRCAERHLAKKRIYESEKEPGGQPSPCKNDHIIHGRFDARVTVFVGRIRFLRHAAMVTISETIRTKKYQ